MKRILVLLTTQLGLGLFLLSQEAKAEQQYFYQVIFTCRDCGKKRDGGSYWTVPEAQQAAWLGVQRDPQLIPQIVQWPVPESGGGTSNASEEMRQQQLAEQQRREQLARREEQERRATEAARQAEAQRVAAAEEARVQTEQRRQAQEDSRRNKIDDKKNQIAQAADGVQRQKREQDDARRQLIEKKVNQLIDYALTDQSSDNEGQRQEELRRLIAGKVEKAKQDAAEDRQSDDARANLNQNKLDQIAKSRDQQNDARKSAAEETARQDDIARLMEQEFDKIAKATTKARDQQTKVDNEELGSQSDKHAPRKLVPVDVADSNSSRFTPAADTPAGPIDTPIDELRRRQQGELDAARKDLRNRVAEPGANEQELVQEYKDKVAEIRNRYNGQDTRNQRLDETLKQTGAKNTGSPTKDVRADLDTAGNGEVNEKMIQEMRDRGHHVETKDSKIVDRTDDHTHWRESTPEGELEKSKDYDSYKTTGGQKAVGNSAEVKDARGEEIDHRSKFEHARADGDTKTMGKGVVKAVDAADGTKFDPDAVTEYQVQSKDPKTGEFMFDNNGAPKMETRTKKGGFVKDQGSFVKSVGPDAEKIYDQASEFKKYGDGVTSGVTSPADSPDDENPKLQKWSEGARDLTEKAQVVGDRRGDLRDKVRGNFADSYRNSNQADPDQRSLDGEAAKSIETDRAKVRDTNKVGQEFLDGEMKKPTAKEFYIGGWKDGQPHGAEPHAGDPNASQPQAGEPAAGEPHAATEGSAKPHSDGPQRGTPTTDANVPAARENPIGQVQGVRGANAGSAPADSNAKPVDGNNKPDLAGSFFAGAQLGRAGVDQLSEAASQNRDLKPSDVVGALDKATGFSGIKNTAEGISREEQIKVERGEQGQVQALGTTGLRLADGMARSMINQPVDEAIRNEEARARKEGREPNYWRSALNGAAHIGGEFTGMNAAFQGIAEANHIENHSAAAAQQAALNQYIQSERLVTDKHIDNLWRQMEQLQSNGGSNNPKDVQAMKNALTQFEQQYKKLQRLDDAASRMLGVNGRPDPYGVVRKEAAGRMGEAGKDLATPFTQNRLSPDNARREFANPKP